MFMLEKLKKHSVKIFVFTINILLAAIAVLIIREKDQARLLENAQKELSPSENSNGNQQPSFENSVSVENADIPSAPADVSDQTLPVESKPDPSATSTPAAPDPIPSPAITVPSTPAPTSAPAPAPTAKPSNAKTKTS
jgi:hypothetical protein